MKANFTIGRIWGIPIGFNISWLLIFGLVTYSLAMGLFPGLYEGGSLAVYLVLGAITSLPAEARQPGWLYQNQRLDAMSQCDWIGASKGQIDELKETQAAVLRLKYNLSTDEDEIARLGKDWRVVKRQRAREKEMDKTLDLTVAEDTTTPGAVDTAAQVESGDKDD